MPHLDPIRWVNSRAQIGHGYAFRLDTLECDWVPLARMAPKEFGKRRFYESPALIGCVLAIGRGLYRELWGFDAAMRSWGVEDIDFGLKAWLLGYPILHDPQAIVGHRFRQAFDNYDVPPADVLANQLRFARKHFSSAVWSQWVEACRLRNSGPLPGHPEGLWARAWSVFVERRESVEHERQYLMSRRVRDEFDYAAAYSLDWPRLSSQREESSAPVAESAPALSQMLQLQPSPSPSPPPPPCGLTGISPDHVMICVGHEQEFVAQGQNLDDVEWAAPGATPPTGKGPSFKTKWTTPVGRTSVYARCGPGQEHFQARVIVIEVAFDHNPVRTGYMPPSQSIDVRSGMIVTPPEFAVSVKPKRGGDVSNRIKEPAVISANPQTGRVEFEVGGEKATPAERPDGDTEIVLEYNDQGNQRSVLGSGCSARVLVIVPKAIKTPHPDATGVVSGVNMVLNSESTPVLFKIPEGYVALATVYHHEMTVEVVDQFDKPLDPIYDESLVREMFFNDWYSIEQRIKNGVYKDPVGDGPLVMRPVDPMDPNGPQKVALFLEGEQEVKDWPTKPRLAAIAREFEQNIPVEVAGHTLLDRIDADTDDDEPDTAVKARKVKITPDPNDPTIAEVVITWP